MHGIRVLPPVTLCLLVILLPGSPSRSQDEAYLQSLIEDAHRLELARDPHWHTLLHYKGGLFGFRSLVDDPKFFLAKDGKHDSEAELDATIRAFFQPPVENEKHAVCRFPARFDWLTAKLAIDESRLPVPRCDPFEALLRQIQPNAITLIFPASHMNSPASMYGHTLLTIRTEAESDLLSYAVNYAAQTQETFGPIYMVKGLFGGYKGYFSILPYYAKLQEYSDVNDRDIWEYPLDFNAEEIRGLLAHVYEMQEIYADYFFFSENCSYDLLFLLDAARQGLDLTDHCAWWVIPLDTIREIKNSGLMKDAIYRPSRSTKVKHLISLLPDDGRKSALRIADGTLEPEEFLNSEAATEEKIKVCDLAGEYLQYVYAKKELPESTYVDRFLKTLNARSALGAAEEDPAYRIPAPPRPEEGHHSNRASLGFGVKGDRTFEEIRLRPAYHTLLDNEPGYKPGSQIVFMDFAMRYYSADQDLQLESVDLIDIVSIAPRDAFFKHRSWKFRTDFFRRTVRKDEDDLVYRLNPGFGRAYESRFLGLWHVMLETDFHAGGALDGGYSAGAGLSTGLVKSLTRSWKIQLLAADVYHALGDTDNLITAGLGQNLQIHPDMSVSMQLSGDWNDEDTDLEAMLRWNAFF